jgi:hypothetical protein
MSIVFAFILLFKILQEFLLFPKLNFIVYLFNYVVAYFIMSEYFDEVFDFDIF